MTDSTREALDKAIEDFCWVQWPLSDIREWGLVVLRVDFEDGEPVGRIEKIRSDERTEDRHESKAMRRCKREGGGDELA